MPKLVSIDYVDSWLNQMYQRHYPALIGDAPKAQEMASLATTKAFLCDRKPVDTNSRSQKDQLLWSAAMIAVLQEHLPEERA